MTGGELVLFAMFAMFAVVVYLGNSRDNQKRKYDKKLKELTEENSRLRQRMRKAKDAAWQEGYISGVTSQIYRDLRRRMKE